MTVRDLFVSRLYEASLAEERDFAGFNAELASACAMLAEEDRAGRAWCKANAYPGYTSYASLDDLTTRAPPFAALAKRLSRHISAFAADLAFDLGPRGCLKLDSLWVSVLRGGAHSAHIHPHAVISGTYYVATPSGAGGLRLEDPRLAMMMATPPRLPDAPGPLKSFVTIEPRAGTLLLWESWLRHEVLAGTSRSPRISVSFNYGWG